MGSPPYDFTALPQTLLDRVMNDSVPARMTVRVGDQHTIVVGWPLQSDNAYFEFQPRRGQQHARSIRLSLLFAGILTTDSGAAREVFAARAPYDPCASPPGAKAIAGGRLDTRLEPTTTQTSAARQLVNDMAAALQLASSATRDSRPTSARAPLTADDVAASIESWRAARDEMPERAQAALDLLRAM